MYYGLVNVLNLLEPELEEGRTYKYRIGEGKNQSCGDQCEFITFEISLCMCMHVYVYAHMYMYEHTRVHIFMSIYVHTFPNISVQQKR